MSARRKQVSDSLLRVFLRLLPIVPGSEIYDLIRRAARSSEDTEKQIKEAMDALYNSSELIGRLESTLKDREVKLTALKEEYERVSQLASLTREQGEAIAGSLEKVIGKSQGKERVIAFITNISAGVLVFVLGVFASDWVKSLPSLISGLWQ
ncbi:hypothetical protein [uncultured Roseibium sp.]|uniref:hypothetical protein n=1 Tax=uncultured Roseibium sp. TaxID=1936171 RepID=UPI0032176FB9